MARRWFYIIPLVVLVLVVLFADRIKRSHRWRRKFSVVKEGVLLRGQQPTLAQLKKTKHRYDIRTIINLLHWDELEDYPECDAERKFAAEGGIRFIHMPLSVPRPEQITKFLGIVNNSNNWPIFIHCMKGTVRTGTLVALFRIENEGWSNQEAFDEMLSFGFDPSLHEHRSVAEFVLAYRGTTQSESPSTPSPRSDASEPEQ